MGRAGESTGKSDAGSRGEPGDGRVLLWGVLNVTPDSFSDGGRFLSPQAALDHGRRLMREGADVIDVGGASSRPPGALYGAGAESVSVAEEKARVVPVIELLAQELGACVSVDTVQAEVAEAALDAGASIVNDVSCAASAELLRVVARRKAGYVLMHTRGRGEVAPPNTDYADVVVEVRGELLARARVVQELGVEPQRIWLDPGLGFAKTAAQSLRLLAHLDRLCDTGMRVLAGPSRKGFIAETAPEAGGERPAPEARTGGTAAAVSAAVLAGAMAVRVHDVATMRQAVRVAEALRDARGRP